jgi:hypothetical protein
MEFLRTSLRLIWHFRPLRDRQKCPSLALQRLPTICRGRADWAEVPATAPAPVVWECKVTELGQISVNGASVRPWLCKGLRFGVLHPEPDQPPSWTTRLLLRRKEVCLRHPILHTGTIPVDICGSIHSSIFFFLPAGITGDFRRITRAAPNPSANSRRMTQMAALRRPTRLRLPCSSRRGPSARVPVLRWLLRPPNHHLHLLRQPLR